MRFSDMPYQRPDFDKLESDFRQKIDVLINSDSALKQARVIDEINVIREDVDTAMSLARIRQTIDTRDAFYDGESSFFDENSPRYQALIDEYYCALTNSRFRPELENRFGKRLFALAEAAQKTFKPEIMEESFRGKPAFHGVYETAGFGGNSVRWEKTESIRSWTISGVTGPGNPPAINGSLFRFSQAKPRKTGFDLR